MNDPLNVFISKIDGFSSLAPAIQNEHLAYYLHSIGKVTFTASEIDALRAPLKLPAFNTAVRLSADSRKSRTKKNNRFVKAKKGYFLERRVFEELDNKYGRRPTAVFIQSDLIKHLAKLADPNLREYLAEAINCFDSNYFRAAIVMAWCAGYGILRAYLFNRHLTALNTAMASWKTPRTIAKVEDFDELGERVVLDVAKGASAITKEQHKQLVALLDQRNSFAHPSGRKVSAPIAEAYLTQIIDEVIVNFS